jgi:hypothetical protein
MYVELGDLITSVKKHFNFFLTQLFDSHFIKTFKYMKITKNILYITRKQNKSPIMG